MDKLIHQRPLPYTARLDERAPDDIDLLVIHCTELPDLREARRYGEKVMYAGSGTGNSGHFYIDRDGRVEQWVATTRTAHHVRSFNDRSIGVEMVNHGRYPDWHHSARQRMTEVYPDRQIRALSALIGHLEQVCPALRYITGHEELDLQQIPSTDQPGVFVRRKLDPGPLFPWDAVLAGTQLAYVKLEDL